MSEMNQSLKFKIVSIKPTDTDVPKTSTKTIVAPANSEISGPAAVLQLEASERWEYSWTLSLPPRSRLEQHFRVIQQQRKPNPYTFHIKFSGGVLGQIRHDWSFTIDKNCKIVASLLVRKSAEFDLLVSKCTLQTFSGEILKDRMPLPLKRINKKAEHNFSTWSTSRSGCIPQPIDIKDVWDESVDQFKIVLTVLREPSPQCLTKSQIDTAPATQTLALPSTVVNEFLTSKIKTQSKGPEPDVTLMAGGQEFHAYQKDLADKSPYFERLFKKGQKRDLGSDRVRVQMKCIHPDVLRQLLRFYSEGQFEATEGEGYDLLAVRLFIAADKYEFEELKKKSRERILRPDMTLLLLEASGSRVDFDAIFTQRVVEILKENKATAFQDGRAYKDFSDRYPEWAYAVFKK